MTPAWERHAPEDGRAWDGLLLEARDPNVFQSAGWGEYKRAAGWTPIRWVGREDGRVAMVVQLLTRRLSLGVLLAWAPGGPVVGFETPHGAKMSRWLPPLLSRIRRTSTAAYLRFDCYLPDDPDAVAEISTALQRPTVRVNTGLTTVLDLRKPMDALLAEMRPEHRRHLRRAGAAGLRWATGRGKALVDDLVFLHGDMLAAKRLRARRAPTTRDLMSLLDAVDGAFVTVGYHGDDPVTAGLTLHFGGRAILQTPATGVVGRGLSASYALVIRVVEELKAEGATELDLAGLAPTSDAGGVDQFKRGFGGTIFPRIGEWEWASPRVLRLVANAALASRGSEVTG